MDKRITVPALVILLGALPYGIVATQVPRPAPPQTPAARARPSQDAIVPFKIHVSDEVLRDLKERLARTRFPDAIAGSGWDYGTDLGYLKELVAYWRDKFDWREQERRLNQFEQFTTNIDGLDIHFIHRRSKQANPMPLLMSHGWPGSFFEFSKVIGPLTDPIAHGGRAQDAFDVVAVSIPGYGFSDRPDARGFNAERMAGLLAKLMARLGYSRYGAQGGDVGAGISRMLALNDAGHMAGLHLNFCTAGAPPGVSDPNAGVPAAELDLMRARQAYFSDDERGYMQIQGTKPQTLGYSLNDSPAGLAAWIVEKYRKWCDCDGNPEKKFTKDEILTNITIYWVTQTITSSTRYYYEGRHTPIAPVRRVEVPTACARFPHELNLPPRRWVEALYNVRRWTDMPRGGHFAALEQPDLLVDDIRAFFRDLR